MKYYGMKYEGNIDAYEIEKAVAYDNPYVALADADKQWSNAYSSSESRLLIVFRKDDIANLAVENNVALFGFSSTKTCKFFIENRKDIVWSSMSNQMWNGDDRHMTPNISL